MNQFKNPSVRTLPPVVTFDHAAIAARHREWLKERGLVEGGRRRGKARGAGWVGARRVK